ncbi:MAG: hypothetical protein C0501_11755 [Isosphaera sp.]|nr:hypothetical protein [Isosphaera sp.]
MSDANEPDVTEKPKAKPLPYEPDGEVLDWDAYVPPPPPLRRGKILVRFRRREATPLPYPDPDEEQS